MNPIIIAIAGGTGSGKTFLSKKIVEEYSINKVLSIEQDSYYKDLKFLSYENRMKQNFDHPNSIDITLLKNHLKSLLNGNQVKIPLYDFTKHLRMEQTKTVKCKSIIIIEGILVLHYQQLRKLYTIKIFVDTPENIRFERRLKRDKQERGRTLKSIKEQYFSTVKPMHVQFVEPSKHHADLIIKGVDYNNRTIDLIKANINSIST